METSTVAKATAMARGITSAQTSNKKGTNDTASASTWNIRYSEAQQIIGNELLQLTIMNWMNKCNGNICRTGVTNANVVALTKKSGNIIQHTILYLSENIAIGLLNLLKNVRQILLIR